ncbi:MAG TPA: sigma 54-interacting transcriptional regulator [Bdellovibrionales bacterium]|nr:sigma 54-interacting transcriptional regulator [Bdellovibrionales bacterium]
MTTQTFLPEAPLETAFIRWRRNALDQNLEIAESVGIGRTGDNQVALDDEFASSRHARIERRPGGGYLLRDLRSRNGTFVNGTKIVEAVLNDGDRIRIGQSDMVFSKDRGRGLTAPEMTSKNPYWNLQLQRLSNISQSSFPVLLTGPSGTGKDVLAQAIHRMSPRKAGPIVSVNCSALSEALVESELFGHKRGSFTGATENRKGAFEAARGGTLFLDEIGDLPLALQPKLLRALENNQIRPVGCDRDITTDVRILAATHHDLKKQVLEERFRADLYFRLHVVQLQTPALTERMEDFEDLLYGFAREMHVRFSFGAIQVLKRHTWPGNIRELRNVVARARAFWGSAEIGENQVSGLLEHKIDEREAQPLQSNRSVIRQIEAEMIRSRLIANHGNQRKTAAELGMAKSTLHDRLRAYGIDVRKIKDL